MKIPAGKTLTALAVVALASATLAGAGEIDRTFEKRFDVRPGARLDLRHGDGKAVITPWDEDAIEVEVRYKAEYKRVGLGSDPDLEVRFEQHGDVVEVIGEEKSVGGVGFFSLNEIEYVYRVRAPSYVELDLEGDDGDVEVGGWRAPIRIRNDDGDVDLAGLTAGKLEVKTGDGDVEIELAAVLGPLDLEVSTDDGDVEIALAAGIPGSFTLSSDDGGIRVDAAAEDLEKEPRRVAGRLGDGSGQIRVTSNGGRISLRQPGS